MKSLLWLFSTRSREGLARRRSSNPHVCGQVFPASRWASHLPPRWGGVGGGAGATEEPGVGARSYGDEAPFAAKPCPRISPSAPPSVTSLEAGLQRGKCIQVRSRRGRGALVPREGPCERSGTRPGAGPWWGPALPAPDPMAPTPAWKSTSPVSEPQPWGAL